MKFTFTPVKLESVRKFTPQSEDCGKVFVLAEDFSDGHAVYINAGTPVMVTFFEDPKRTSSVYLLNLNTGTFHYNSGSHCWISVVNPTPEITVVAESEVL